MERAGGHPLRQYYVAVSSAENKLATLLDLLRAFEATAPLTVVACCGSRDSLDAVVAAAVGVSHCRVWVLHADLTEREVESTVRDYRAATRGVQQQEQQKEQKQEQGSDVQQPGQQQQQQRARAPAPGSGSQAQGPKQQEASAPVVAVLATTDAGLRALPRELLPLSPALLISYDLPTRKDVYLRRITHVLGSRSSAGRQRIAVNFAIAGQLEEFRQVEEFSEKPIEEMPVHVSDIFAGAS